MELLDLLTPEGLATGVTKPKRDVHRDGDLHRSSHMWVVASDGRVLLQRRALVKESWPGLWDISVAGHLSAGETAIEGVIREAYEELGLRVTPGELTFLGTLRYHCVLRDDFVENEIHEAFLLRRDVDLASLTLDPDEVVEVAFVRPEDFDRYERVPHEEEYALLFAALA